MIDRKLYALPIRGLKETHMAALFLAIFFLAPRGFHGMNDNLTLPKNQVAGKGAACACIVLGW